MAEVRRRRASRVLLIDDQQRVLLLRSGVWWFTVGGGIEVGETAEEAAVREVAEETGIRLRPADLGPVVHRREVELTWGGERLRSDEEFRVAHVGPASVDTAGFTALERSAIAAWRWWSLTDLRALESAATGERLAPDNLADLLEQALSGQGPQ